MSECNYLGEVSVLVFDSFAVQFELPFLFFLSLFFSQAAPAGTQIAAPLMVQEKNDRVLENEDN